MQHTPAERLSIDPLEAFRRQFAKLRVFLESTAFGINIYESDIDTYNELISSFEPLGLEVNEWYVPTELLRGKPEHISYVGGDSRAIERRVSQSKFRLYSVPAFEALRRELNRREAEHTPTTKPERASSLNPAEVWVVYGRNEGFRKTIFRLLRDVGLQPIEFNKAIARSGSGSPNVIDVVLREITRAPAIVCLFTPDDYAELRAELRRTPANPNDKDEIERLKDSGYQPRPNVLLETGMALAAMRHKTVIVSASRTREISDLGGPHEVRWEETPAKRLDLVNRL